MGLAIGGLATIVGGIVFSLGWLDRLNGYNLDHHFRHFNRIEADPRIVLIDIDDSTLKAMPTWPWSRRVHADLVRILHELGSRAILLDFVFDQPSSPRVEHAGLSRNEDVDSGLQEFGDRAFDETIYDDNELRDALVEAGNVYLAMFSRIAPPGIDPETIKRPRIAQKGGHTHSPRKQSFEVHAEQSARQFFDENPEGAWPEYFRSFFRDRDISSQSPERQQLLLAFRLEKELRAITSKSPGRPNEGRIVQGYDLSPPIERLAKAAAGVGIVSFSRGESEHVVRALPLVVEARQSVLLQLGLLVAMEALSIPPSQIALQNGAWVFGAANANRVVPLSGQGTSLVNWHAPTGGSWRLSFRHIPALRLLEIVQNRRAIEDNGRRLGIARAELVEVRHAETPGAYAGYVRLVNERLELERARTRSSLPSPQPSPLKGEGGGLAALNDESQRIEDEAIVWVQRAWQLWSDETPQNEQETAEKERIKRLYDRFGDGQYAALLDRANARMNQRNKLILDELRPQLQDKICLVGYTATGMADMVPTPVDPAMPGVMVHANVINMFLQNRFASEASRGVTLAIMILMGLVTTLTSCARGSRFGLLSLFVLVAGILGVGVALFWFITYHIGSFVVVVLVILVWASVTVYRQATEERARRAFQRALAQYTSPAVAIRIAERSKADDLGPQQALVTCFFSDLADFTRLSERLGPQQTRQLLNPYLRGVSAALLDQGAIINKFMGDGVFAFFNAPILPCIDHARAACASALASLAAVARCNDQRRQGGEADLLIVRIGLSTGEAFVGDYGSDMKLDYTCIGDTVNLGSRLEQANKAFGTAILVDDATRQGAGDEFLFRSLGLIEVAGKAAAVAVHELVGTVTKVEESTRVYIELFETAIGDFQHCRWESCLAVLVECRKQRPLDHAVDLYEAAVARHRVAPPISAWAGAIPISVY